MPNFASPADPNASRLQDAARLLAAKSYREVHAICLEVLKSDPANGEAYYLLGILTSDHANYARAEELFRAAIARAPDHAAAHAQRARCLIALSRRADAVEAVRRAALAKPEDGFTLDTIGVVLSRAGLHTEALPWYARATRTDPGNAGFHYNHAAALQFAGEMGVAREAYRRCAGADPAIRADCRPSCRSPGRRKTGTRSRRSRRCSRPTARTPTRRCGSAMPLPRRMRI